MKASLYLTHAVVYSTRKDLEAILKIMDWLGWSPPHCTVGIKDLALLTKGRFNPSGDFALVMPDGELVRNPFDLIHWLDAKGLQPL